MKLHRSSTGWTLKHGRVLYAFYDSTCWGHIAAAYFYNHGAVFNVAWLHRILCWPGRLRRLVVDTVRDWQRRMELAHLRRSTICAGQVEIGYYRDTDEPIIVKCGDWARGEVQLCERCTRIAHLEYPQGWYYYPGDVCPHGRYTGGCGVDIICPNCELE